MYNYKNYVTEAQFKFNELSDELKKEAMETYNLLEEKTPEIYENVIDYYYQIQKSLPNGWFCWWED